MHVDRATLHNLRPVTEAMVADEAHVMTGTSSTLRRIGLGQKHDKVNHYDKEYVRYEDGVCITTSSVEGYFANLKRGIHGVYHHVGKHHLHRHLSEIDFRYNARKIKDGERTLLTIKGVNGKRLMAPGFKNESPK